ncbi:MAG: hypothetical protein J5742_01955 [Alphaproteobacteria bacterium]|nr:hypothetical protein [Alphaproteobacteria bacterium]
MTEKIEMEPLYERDYNLPKDTYVCSATGLVCEKVSQHFREYRAFVKRMSESNDKGSFFHYEPNLCTDPNYFGRCSVYDNFIKKVTEFANAKNR